MRLLKEFREFAVKGNAFDLAIGVVIGAAFSQIVNSLVNDILMPPLGYLTGGFDFSQLYINLSGGEYESLAAAQTAGAATINYGLFISALVKFIIVAWVLFLVVRTVNRLREEHRKWEEDQQAKAPATPREQTLLEEIRDLLKAD